MYYYVYKITNKINGKFYIGKHRHANPHDNSYYGSGKLIKSAIKKYGKENFHKEIIQIFATHNEAADLEKSLVTKEIIENDKCYNLHEGGHGGFGHINNVPPDERVNIIEFRRKVGAGEIVVGGTKHWSEESWKAVLNQSWGARIKRGEFVPNTWKNLSEEEYNKRVVRLSESSTGSKNSQFGTHIYIDSEFSGNLPETSILNKQRYKEGEQPIGWITVREWANLKKKRNHSSTGRHWYNDGISNFYLYPSDEKIRELSKGRLNLNNCCGHRKTN